MATVDEIRQKLEGMNALEFQEFKSAFGGDGNEPRFYVNTFLNKPELEAKLCYALGLKTEQEKINEATLATAVAASDSARAAKDSANIAKESLQFMRTQARSAWIAALVAVLALTFQVIALIVAK